MWGAYRSFFDRGDDGRVAVTTSGHGKGRTVLIGTHTSAGHFRDIEAGGEGAAAWFAACMAWAGIVPVIDTGNPAVQGRLHVDGDQHYLWLVNPTDRAQDVAVRVNGVSLNPGVIHWGEGSLTAIPARNAVIMALRP